MIRRSIFSITIIIFGFLVVSCNESQNESYLQGYWELHLIHNNDQYTTCNLIQDSLYPDATVTQQFLTIKNDQFESLEFPCFVKRSGEISIHKNTIAFSAMYQGDSFRFKVNERTLLLENINQNYHLIFIKVDTVTRYNPFDEHDLNPICFAGYKYSYTSDKKWENLNAPKEENQCIIPSIIDLTSKSKARFSFDKCIIHYYLEDKDHLFYIHKYDGESIFITPITSDIPHNTGPYNFLCDTIYKFKRTNNCW